MRHTRSAVKIGARGTTVKSGAVLLRWEEWANAVTPGANIVNDTRVLLNRIAEFRKRLEGMPRLVPAQRTDEPPSTPPEPNPDQAEAGSRTQAIIEKSLQRLAGADCAGPPPLSNNARRLMSDAHGMVTP